MNTTIERLRCQYLIPASHPAPTTIQACLDSIARDYLAGICSTLLTSLLDPHDTSFWLIRRLDVSVSLNVEHLDAAAQIWGRSIVKALIRALTTADEVDQDLVRHFPHRNAYVAQFISDLVAGQAWDRWYYRTFDSLRSLSASSAIYTALTREPEQIASILALLAAQGRSEPVLQCLTEGDARLLYEMGYPTNVPTEILTHEPSLAPETASDRQHWGHVEETNATSSRGLKSDIASGHHQPLSIPSIQTTDVARSGDNKPAPGGQMLSPSDISETRIEDSKLTLDGQPLLLPGVHETNVAQPVGSKRVTDEEEGPAILKPYRDYDNEAAVERLQSGEMLRDGGSFVAPATPQHTQLNPRVGIEISVMDEASTHVAQEATAGEERHILELLLSVWGRASLQLSGTRIATPHNALRLYTTLWVQVSHYPCTTVRDVIEHILSFAQLLRVSGQSTQMISYMLDSNLTAALNLLREANLLSYLKSLSYLQQIVLGDTALLRRIASTIAPSTVVKRETVTNRLLQPVTTLLGGIFLLLPAFIDLKFHELLEHAPYRNIEEQKLPILRFLLFLKCFGLLHTQWPDIIYDPILLLVSSAEDIPMAEALQQLSQNATLSMNLAWQRSLLKLQVNYHYAEGRYLYAELVEVSAGPVLLIRDMHHDAWLYIRSVSQEIESIRVALMDGLAIIQETIDRPAEFLVLGTGLEQLSLVDVLYDQPLSIVWTEPGQSAMRMAWQPGAATSHNEGTCEECRMVQEKSTELLHSIQQLTAVEKDLHYLTLDAHGQPMIEQRDLDLTLSLFARVLMRTFARRLMGFGKSSCEYLYQNFLAGTASVLIQHDLLEVQIPRPPLHLVLRIAGMHEQSYAVPWFSRQVIVELVG